MELRSALAGAPGAGRSAGARGCPDVDLALLRVALDLLELGGLEIEPLEGGDVLLELLHAARPDEGGGDPGITQDPCDGELGQRLPASARDLVERPHPLEVLLGAV